MLGLLKRSDVPENIKSLIEKRETARKNNLWSEADALRIEIKNKEANKSGVRVEVISYRL